MAKTFQLSKQTGGKFGKENLQVTLLLLFDLIFKKTEKRQTQTKQIRKKRACGRSDWLRIRLGYVSYAFIVENIPTV